MIDNNYIAIANNRWLIDVLKIYTLDRAVFYKDQYREILKIPLQDLVSIEGSTEMYGKLKEKRQIVHKNLNVKILKRNLIGKLKNTIKR